MIKSVELTNFFSFRHEEISLHSNDLSICLGINGSGKSNFLRAIYLLHVGVVNGGFEKIFLNEWGGFSSVSNYGADSDNTITLRFEFDTDKLNQALDNKGFRFGGRWCYEIHIHQLSNSSFFLEESVCFFDGKDDAEGSLILHVRNGNGQACDNDSEMIKITQSNEQLGFKNTELILNQLPSPHQFSALYALKKAIEKISIYDCFDTSFHSIIRKPAINGTDDKLLINGENLAAILLKTKNNHLQEYEKIEELLKNINPNFKDIHIDPIGSRLELKLREKGLNKTIAIQHISDGTLRYLLLLSILLNPKRGALICLDEPEMGLHPDMINTLARLLKEASQSSQIIITTHSPLLLNSFELEDVLIFEKDKSNCTTVSKKEEEDLVYWDENSLLGQFWMNGLIGAKRW